jgi:hypothetical protein
MAGKRNIGASDPVPPEEILPLMTAVGQVCGRRCPFAALYVVLQEREIQAKRGGVQVGAVFVPDHLLPPSLRRIHAEQHGVLAAATAVITWPLSYALVSTWLIHMVAHLPFAASTVAELVAVECREMRTNPWFSLFAQHHAELVSPVRPVLDTCHGGLVFTPSVAGAHGDGPDGGGRHLQRHSLHARLCALNVHAA